ncbi:MAG TPA: phytoene/squalene synthase family protein [Nitrospiraceae bacterium]|nr:phytoene/squalene synthase family protein [Nitrospiraceae bacterium]
MTTSHLLLTDILKKVSRSFYLTVAVVPRTVREQIGLAYLFARAADTIVDTDLIERSRRLILLKDFRAQFAVDLLDWTTIRSIQSALVPHQASAGERALMQRLEECFQLFGTLSSEDQHRIRTLMGTLIKGMEMDLTVFPGDSVKDLTAFQTMEELDRYTYYVAGCVGEFWTDMVAGHVTSLRAWNVTDMARVGVRFGKGLQLTNILKDVARDLQRGRCYIPTTLLQEARLTPSDLLNTDNRNRVQPVLRKLIGTARDHLDQGWMYTLAIPRREVRLRLACMWPILFAGQTLQRVADSIELLDPAVNVKIPKGQVYRIMAWTTLTGGCGYVGSAYWGRVRKGMG